MKRIILILIAIIILMTLGSCTNTKDSDQVSWNESLSPSHAESSAALLKAPEIRSLIEAKISNQYSYTDFAIIENIEKDNVIILSFYFLDNNYKYEGIACVRKNDGSMVCDISLVDTKVPFTHHEMGCEMNGQPAKIVSGYINDLTINEIRIHYKDQTDKVIKMGPGQQMYLDPVLGKESAVKSIFALNEKGISVYSYSW